MPQRSFSRSSCVKELHRCCCQQRCSTPRAPPRVIRCYCRVTCVSHECADKGAWTLAMQCCDTQLTRRSAQPVARNLSSTFTTSISPSGLHEALPKHAKFRQ
eukprot:6613-Heterococcus_DN1.PRE.1